jgi:uncharacterized protein YndB with AHSA1/START domain
VQISQRVHSPAERVFDAWLDARLATRWLFATSQAPSEAISIDATVGGTFAFVERRRDKAVAHAGRYIDLKPARRLVFSLRSDELANEHTVVDVSIAPVGSGCAIVIRHRNLPASVATYVRNRWSGMLYGLAALLEGGAQDG